MSNKHITVCDQSQGDSDWPPTALGEFFVWFAKIASQIPPEHIGSARIYITSGCSYDSSSANVEITYERPETPEEIATRNQEEANRRAQNETLEKRRLAELLQKYGKP